MSKPSTPTPAERNRSGIIIAGTGSSSGKTAVTCMLLAALRARGVAVQPFKVGPDFIDPAYHARYAGAPSRNLDTWLMGRDAVLREIAAHAHGKIAVVEGVLGLFDGGCATSDDGSAMELARMLDWPVVLVVPAAKAGRSLAATLRGFIAEAGENRICGVVLNGVSGSSHAEFLREAIAPLRVPVLGVVPPREELRWPERHLGLTAATETPLPADAVLARLGEESLDVENVLRALPGKTLPPHLAPGEQRQLNRRIALARDEAFHFYYESNLDFLRASGCEVVAFSPLHDSAIPSDADALILGGGFPESFAARLSENSAMRASIRSALASGLPCYAECGGLMLLADELATLDGKHFPMAGVLPGTVEMTPRLSHFGYCEAEKNGRVFRGHEFHHSRWTGENDHANLWNVTKRRSRQTRREGFGRANLHASYVHLFWQNAAPLFAELLGQNQERAAA